MPAHTRKILTNVLKGKLSKAAAAKRLGVSRKTIYIWLSSFKPIKKKISKRIKSEIIKITISNPSYGPKKISYELKRRDKEISGKTVWKILKSLDLATRKKREEYSYYYIVPRHTKDSLFSGNLRLTSYARKRMVEDVVLSGKKPRETLTLFKISRKTFAKWKKRYVTARDKNLNLLSALSDQHPKGSDHPRGTSEKIVRAVLDLVAENPALSSHKIASQLSFIGNHGVQRILERNNLSHHEMRLAYSQAKRAEVKKPAFAYLWDKIKLVWEKFIPSLAPAPPRTILANLRGKPFVRSFLISLGSSTLISLAFIYWFSLLGTSSFSNGLGLFFATIALFMGSLFFAYSMKYYLTLAFVLSYSQQEVINNQRLVTGLTPNLDHIILHKHPLISIHIPLYNEPKVVERIIKATTSFDYPNYEVILADDSNDETTQVIDNYLKQFNGSSVQQSDEYTLTQAEIRPGVTVKHLHRTTRAGFKGGGLRLALEVSDPKAKYVSVFDADFVPYPDTLTLFLKYFQASSESSNIAAVQGYQWHVLNKSENWITRGVRSEYAGSYVIERSGSEIYSGLKQISGSVYMIRKDILQQIGWGTSITEDFELTLKLYEKGFKVLYTPYIQAPAECVSTIKRLVRQRMRWAEGHSHNIRRMFLKLLTSPKLTKTEKLEFLYLSPYYLQAFFFIVGTISWFISETIFPARLPFWTSLWGWSLVLTNFISLPLMNGVGMFLEESEEKDYLGLMSFIILSYIVVPFQAYASLKGFLEKTEGPWFRTPKTGHITDILKRSNFYRWLLGIFPRNQSVATAKMAFIANSLGGRSNRIGQFTKVRRRVLSRAILSLTLSLSLLLISLTPKVAIQTSASKPTLKTVENASLLPPLGKIDVRKEIKSAWAIEKTTTGGKNLEFIFKREPTVTIRLDSQEFEVETQTVRGKKVSSQKASVFKDKEVTYEEVVPGVDLKYSFTNDLLVEEFIFKDRVAGERFGGDIVQKIRTANVRVVSANPGTFGFYPLDCSTAVSESNECKELFTFVKPFMKDAVGNMSRDLEITLEKKGGDFRLLKSLSGTAREWLLDPDRVYPVALDPSIVVSGGIVEAEVQFGGLQRKLAYMANANGGAAWYALYNDGGLPTYKRCLVSSNCDEAADWSAGQDLDTDTDSFNPSLSVSGDIIIVFWIDDTDSDGAGADTADSAEGLRFDVTTAFPHTLGTMCRTTDQGLMGSSFMTSVAAVSGTEAVIGFTDTDGGGAFDMIDFSVLDGTCVNGDITPGNLQAGSGITASDRPVLVPMTSDQVAMVFQDGTDLSLSLFDVSAGDWTTNKLATGFATPVTNNVYSVVTDGTTVWILTVDGTTATNLLACCTADIAETQIDTDAGGNGQDNISDIDMYCPTEDNCKIVYTDDIDTAAPRLMFVDCDNSTCSTSTVTELDPDIGASGDQAGASVYCVTDGTNCKIAYGDDMDTTLPLLNMIDCTADETCASRTNACTVGTCVDTDLGGATSVLHTSINCPADTNCKILYNDAGLLDLFFADCSSESCSTRDAVTQIDSNAGAAPKLDLDCSPGSTNCKFVYYDGSTTGGCADADSICFADCSAEACGAGITLTVIDPSTGTTDNQQPVSIDCIGSDTNCKLVYGEQFAGDMNFVDCPDDATNGPACLATGRTITSIDIDGGANATTGPKVSLDCVSATTCQFTYVGTFTTDGEETYFVYCNGSETCASTNFQVQQLPGPRWGGAIQCLTSSNCKIVYYEGTTTTDPTVQFADCDVANCFPSFSDLADPWTGQTNLTSVSLSLDTTNNNLYAHVIKDTSEQAYFKSSPKASISWGAETSYAFTAGDLGHISANETGAAASQIGVVLRQTANFEFAAVPENLWPVMIGLPLVLFIYKYKRRKEDARTKK